MSYDTSLHRTFDYQLSPAPLRIIDWAPVKAVARSVLQPGQGAKEFTLVDDATPNASSVAAAYGQQVNQRRVLECREPLVSALTPAATADAAEPGGSLSAIEESATSEFPGLSAASPYYTPGMNSSGGGHAELCALHVDDALPQQQKQQSDARAVTLNEVALGAATGNAAAPLEVLKHTVASSTETTSSVMVPAAAVLVNDSNTGTPAAVMDSAQRLRTSSPFAAPLLLVKGVSQYGAAGMMYGFDSVYHKDSFGVLAGLFTGAGYHQVNTCYRQQQPTPSRRTDLAKGEHGSWTSALGTTARTLPVAVTSAAPTPRSGSTTKIATNRSSSEQGASSVADATGVPSAVELHGEESSALSLSPTQQLQLEQVIASQRHGQLQIYNALQLFWYWGARRWTGVLNVRVTPLPSGDAVLPVCEYVARTAMTECSIVMDDPVVYMHGFVVMLGRRTRPVEKLGSGHGTSAAVVGSEEQRCNEVHQAGSRNPLDAAVAPSLTDEVTGMAAAGTRRPPAERSSHLSVPPAPEGHRDGIKSRVGGTIGGRAAANAPGNAVLASTSFSQTTPLPPSRHSPAMSSDQQLRSSRPPTACTATDSDPAHSTTQYHDAALQDAVTAVGNAGGAPLPEWLYWYQRCVLETTDEWLWNRAASEVAEKAARSTTPWWKPHHIKMGVGLALRYRKPRGVNVYWGWSARMGRGMHFSGHIDVLRRMSCAVSSTFGFLDMSVRLRVNLVTLHQTALDAGVCWRPMPQVPEFAVRLATSANGTTLGVEIADVAPTLYGPVIAQLSNWRSRRRHAEATELSKGIGDTGEDSLADSNQNNVSGGAPTGVVDGTREDLVGLLPITWHYLQSTGSIMTSAFTSVKGAITNTLASVSSASSGAGSGCSGSNIVKTPVAPGSVSDVRRRPALLSVTPTLATPATPPTLTAGQKLSSMVLPAGKASLRYARNAWHTLQDLGWLEHMLSISHVNVSMGVTSKPSHQHREWSLFLIVSEK
ncbi:hypothetical protein, conserved [Leishmania tarentolae]|uniref:Uncharacterized protein n=1 Tax=Leishmania tarentolae TaxID=5689 RepID=A0A640KD35_LEITA|nr:hypothetical protein, conserved [Leishmania tarentolae]